MDGRSQAAWSAVVRAPMVRLALPFLFGLLLARSLPVGGWMGPACLAGLLALTTVALQRRSRFEQRALRGATVSLFLVFFGLVWGTLKGGPGGPRGAREAGRTGGGPR